MLKRLRGAVGLSQAELAERAGLSVKAISALERGERRRPYPHTLRALAAALRLSAEDRAALLNVGTSQGSREDGAHARGDDAGLSAARELLDSLPLREPPPPGPLPHGSRMPLARGALFIGRTGDLRQMAAALRGGGGTLVVGQVIAATGMGGLGKTQLAVEFVHRYGRHFAGGVFWLSFADREEIPLQVAACGGAGFMDLRDDFARLGLDEQLALVQATWQGPMPRLLVFDNCEEEALLSRWRPSAGGCRVLVTSRRSSWDVALGVESMAVDVLSRTESVELLRRFRPDLNADDTSLDGIAHEVGDLPLALHLAGSFMRRYSAEIEPRDYLAELREPGMLEHASLLGRGLTRELSPTRHIQSVAQTFAMSYGRLDPGDEVDRTALALLARAARLAPGEPMPRDLLLRTLGELESMEDRLTRADALARLGALGLLQPSGDLLRLHRLLVHFVNGVAEDPGASPAVDEALIAAGRMADEGRLAGASLLQAITHLHHVTRLAVEGTQDGRAAALSDASGRALTAAGDFAAARPALERAVAIRERTLGPDHPDTARSLNNLAVVLRAQAEAAASRTLFERVLSIRESALGPEHPDTARTLNDLALLLQDQNELAAARSLFERALAIRERVVGPGDPLTAASLNNLAFLLREAGELATARPLFERALAIRERTLGPDHPDTAMSLNDLALLLRDQGELDEARPLLERAVAIWERALGPEHPDTATSLNNLGAVLRAQGEPAAAGRRFERALAIREHVLGPDHPLTAQSLNNVAGPLQDLGQLEEARRLFERSLAIREQALGPDHTEVGQSLNNLARVLEDQGDLAAARPLFERSVTIWERALGPEHVITAKILSNLARVLRAQGDLAAARPLMERVVTIRAAVLGPRHPETIEAGLLLEDLPAHGPDIRRA
jgi:tetratricopeptide (TPR) repeat protein/transcriptional regulator with XRE-family HTH domain